MLSSLIFPENVSDAFIRQVSKALDKIHPVVQEFLLAEDLKIVTGQTQQDIWSRHPEIIREVGRHSEELAQSLLDSRADLALGYSLHFLDRPTIALAEKNNDTPGLIAIHEIGHTFDLIHAPPFHSDKGFLEAREQDRPLAIEAATWAIRRYGQAPRMKDMHDRIMIQLNGKKSLWELWANHFTMLMAGEPLEPYLVDKFPRSLNFVKEQLSEYLSMPKPSLPAGTMNKNNPSGLNN